MKKEKKSIKTEKTCVGTDHVFAIRGITLVALVITIIILLILAGITINLTIGQRGILKRAEEATKNYANAAKYEETVLNEILGVNEKQEKWQLEGTYTSPNYPEKYPNNSNLNVKKVYDEDVKAIKIVMKDAQFEGGAEFDYMLIKDANDNTLAKVSDGCANMIYIVEGNVLNFSFVSDNTVTRQGFDMDVYLCRDEEEFKSILPGSYYPLSWGFHVYENEQKVEIMSHNTKNSQSEIQYRVQRYKKR